MPIMFVFAMAAVALMIPVMVSWMRQSDQTMLGTVAARQLYAVTQAAKGYITAYAGTIEATATPTTPATITVPMLVATGFLPQGFGAVNPYQQGWEVEVLQPLPLPYGCPRSAPIEYHADQSRHGRQRHQ